MLVMINAVIFDLYGTLLHLPHDSRPFLQLASRLQTTQLRSAINTALSTPNHTLSEFASRLGLPAQDDIASLQAALERDLQNVCPYSDAVSTLTVLKRHNIKMAAISNLATPYKAPLYRHQLASLLDVMVFSCDCGMVKPDRRIYQSALGQLGSSASSTIMVGDSYKSDVEGPSLLGIAGIHLCRSGRPSSAKTFVASLDAFLQYIA